MAGPGDDVLDQLRTTDHDRYLTLLYAPAAHRQALAALYAFDAEIAGIRGRVRDALPGEIRLQWWRDSILADDRDATGHPVADALIQTINQHRLPKLAFENYLEARIFDLYNDPMPTRADLEGYCGETAGAIIQLACLVLDPEHAPSVTDAAGHAGCAQTMTGLLRALPIDRARGQCFIPADILIAVGTTPDAFLSGADTKTAQSAMEAMAALARDHLIAYEKQARSLPPTLRPAFLPLAVTTSQLRRLKRAGGDAVRADELSPLTKHWAILRLAWRGWR